MKILLMRSEYTGPFVKYNLIRTEPLDLEYLAKVAVEEGHEYRIWDPFAKKESLEKVLDGYRPDVVGITGYINARDTMNGYARTVKRISPETVVLIGGVHAEVNNTEFYQDGVDMIVHSGGFQTFRRMSRLGFSPERCRKLRGICIRDENGQWVKNDPISLDVNDMILPDRSHFYRYRDRFTYFHYGTVAMIKSSYGCPFKCNFCYCRHLNEGKYTCRKMDGVMDEIQDIDCDTIWFVDDSFLIQRKRVLEFCSQVKRRGIRKKFLVYSRADFIAKNEDIMPLLREAGVIDIIVGLEAIDNESLEGYDKLYSAQENESCVQILKRHGISLTGLFISHTDWDVNNFRRLWAWIRRMDIRMFTCSIFAPMPGTKEFAEYRDKFLTNDSRKWDFLHHVLRPTKLSRLRFTYEVQKLYYLQVVHNRYTRSLFLQYLRRKLLGTLGMGKANDVYVMPECRASASQDVA